MCNFESSRCAVESRIVPPSTFNGEASHAIHSKSTSTSSPLGPSAPSSAEVSAQRYFCHKMHNTQQPALENHHNPKGWNTCHLYVLSSSSVSCAQSATQSATQRMVGRQTTKPTPGQVRRGSSYTPNRESPTLIMCGIPAHTPQDITQ